MNKEDYMIYTQEITSIKDKHIVLCRELTSGAGRAAHKKFLLYGQEQINWALQTSIHIEFIVSTQKDIVLANGNHIPRCHTSEGIMKKATETSYLIPLIAVANYPAYHTDTEHDFVVVLDRVVDQGNIGTIIRSAHGFGINNFMITSTAADPYQRKIIDASRGTVFASNIMNIENPVQAINILKGQGFQVVVTSPHAKQLQSQASLQKKPIALIVGNEQDGADKSFLEQADVQLQIPMHSVESLNVGVAAGISLYELQFKLVLLMLKEKIVANLGRQINVTGALIQQAFDKHIKASTGLSGMQVILLMIMLCDKRMSKSHISKDVALFDHDLELFLQPLLDRAFIDQHADTYSLAVQGELFLAQIWPIVEKTQEMILKDFNKQERDMLKDFLDRLQHNCNRLIS